MMSDNPGSDLFESDLIYLYGKMSANIYNDQPPESYKHGSHTWQRIYSTNPRDINNQYTYAGAAYFCEDINHVIIVHRGTITLTDWIDSNRPLFLQGKIPKPFTEDVFNFLTIVNAELKSKLKTCSSNSSSSSSSSSSIDKASAQNDNPLLIVSHTGHSLGGAYAAMLGYMSSCRSVSFDSPGISHLLKELDSLGELEKYTNLNILFGSKSNAEKSDLAYNFVAGPNIVNTTGKRHGRWFRIFSDHVDNSPDAAYKTMLDTVTSAVSSSTIATAYILWNCVFYGRPFVAQLPILALQLGGEISLAAVGSWWQNSPNGYDIASHNIQKIVDAIDPKYGPYLCAPIEGWPDTGNILLTYRRITTSIENYISLKSRTPLEINIELERLIQSLGEDETTLVESVASIPRRALASFSNHGESEGNNTYKVSGLYFRNLQDESYKLKRENRLKHFFPKDQVEAIIKEINQPKDNNWKEIKLSSSPSPIYNSPKLWCSAAGIAVITVLAGSSYLPMMFSYYLAASASPALSLNAGSSLLATSSAGALSMVTTGQAATGIAGATMLGYSVVSATSKEEKQENYNNLLKREKEILKQLEEIPENSKMSKSTAEKLFVLLNELNLVKIWIGYCQQEKHIPNLDNNSSASSSSSSSSADKVSARVISAGVPTLFSTDRDSADLQETTKEVKEPKEPGHGSHGGR